jgi:hypothetical protein
MSDPAAGRHTVPGMLCTISIRGVVREYTKCRSTTASPVGSTTGIGMAMSMHHS